MTVPEATILVAALSMLVGILLIGSAMLLRKRVSNNNVPTTAATRTSTKTDTSPAPSSAAVQEEPSELSPGGDAALPPQDEDGSDEAQEEATAGQEEATAGELSETSEPSTQDPEAGPSVETETVATTPVPLEEREDAPLEERAEAPEETVQNDEGSSDSPDGHPDDSLDIQEDHEQSAPEPDESPADDPAGDGELADDQEYIANLPDIEDEEEDEVTQEEEDPRMRALLLVGVPEQPLPGPFWRCVCVDDAKGAMARLAQSQFDLVIVDLKAEAGGLILKKIAKKFPTIPRVVRCKPEHVNDIRKLAPEAQQHLLTNATTEQFFSVLERGTAIDFGALTERMTKALGPVSTLPTLPDNYQQIRRIMAHPDGSIRRIANVIIRDIGLTTKVLQVVNSPLYGLRQSVTDVGHAATLLGMRGVRDLTLTLEVFGYFSSKIPLGGVTVEDLYNYSLKVATVANRIGRMHADDAYTAGLLHQIGRLILMTRKGVEYQDSLDLHETQGGAIRDAQRATIGVDQDETSAYLLSIWGLPQKVIEAVAFYDAPSLVPHDSLDVVDILHVAVALVSEHHGDSPIDLDEMHLDMLGGTHYLPEWREIVEEVCPPPAPPEEEAQEDAEALPETEQESSTPTLEP